MEDARAMNGIGSAVVDTASLCPRLYEWDFSVFELGQQSGGRPLFHVSMALLQDQGLLDDWLLERDVCERFFSRVEAMYRPNPYHNNTHAADVTQTAGVILKSLSDHLGSSSSSGCCGSGGSAAAATAAGSSAPDSSSSSKAGLSKLERFAVIFASVVHDLGHPGVNNYFLVKTKSPMAMTYNDKSVNEMMHVSLAFKLAFEDPSLNVFAKFSEQEYELVRKLILDMVLSTDMDVHFRLLARYADELKQQPDVRQWVSVDQRSLLFQMLVHLADLANPSRPWPLALKWAEGVVTEFLAQGEKEAAAHIPISPPCDRSKVCMPAAQLFFIERFMAPTLEAFSTSAPTFYNMACAWLADTQAKWTLFNAAGVKFPHQGYPQLPAPPADQQPLSVTLPSSSSSHTQPDCCGPHQHSAAAAAGGGSQQPQQVCKAAGAEPQQQQQQQQHRHQQQPVLPPTTQQAAAQAAG